MLNITEEEMQELSTIITLEEKRRRDKANRWNKRRDEDYWVHYLGYSEGNSFEKEERAFFMLKPQKDKVYLNYGCGKWQNSPKDKNTKK